MRVAECVKFCTRRDKAMQDMKAYLEKLRVAGGVRADRQADHRTDEAETVRETLRMSESASVRS
jgi:hypothetical protein